MFCFILNVIKWKAGMINAVNVNVFQNRHSIAQKRHVAFKGLNNIAGDVMVIAGKETKAKIFTNNVNYQTLAQIKSICSHPVFRDIPVRIMPDTHAGKNAVVGFTAPISPTGDIIPSLISGDIGCGMLCVKLDTQGQNLDYKKLDSVINNYLIDARKEKPVSFTKNVKNIDKPVNDFFKYKYKRSSEESMDSLGTLGGGNHFIEIDTDKLGNNYLVIHTGSRKFGKEVYNYHQQIAQRQNPYKIKDWSYLSGDEAKSYLEDMQVATKFSQVNRRIIADEILKRMGWKELESFESIHNYISKEGMIRKGAISSEKGKKVLIPLNMRDGAIIAEGKGNSDWNFSAPHGAGRQFSRSEASELISIDDYKESMNGIYSSCISPSTVDESPLAYKDANEIINNIGDTVDIKDIIKPKYNYKN